MNEPYILGPDPEGDFANRTRVSDAAAEIVEGLRSFLERGSETLHDLLKNCASYERGLTGGETVLAIQMALSIYQIEMIHELAGMHYEPDDGEDDE
ncbi:hypothetical protein [Shinella fusca]|uniref:Uncharacterized protein n=1 Tax=Shinella fusca TaxID=544480 RepID=A0A7W7YTB8_9HYPH|nr:hypothetical protein [Shinella fusca]MBB5041879.1 hypothetical protein [Shinella fusca]